MADINDLSVLQTSIPLVLVNPKTGEDYLNDDEKPMTIHLHGIQSKLGTTASKEIRSGDRADKKISEAEQEKRFIDLFARLTDKFENLQLDGKPLKATHKTASELYKGSPWIYGQVFEFIGMTSNHLGNLQSD